MEGKVHLRQAILNAQSINQFLQNYSIILVKGSIEEVQIQIPFSNLWEGDLIVSVNGLALELCPARVETMSKMDASSLLADDFVKKEGELDGEGAQRMSFLIERLMSRLRIDFTNLSLKFGDVEVSISSAKYFDDSVDEKTQKAFSCEGWSCLMNGQIVCQSPSKTVFRYTSTDSESFYHLTFDKIFFELDLESLPQRAHSLRKLFNFFPNLKSQPQIFESATSETFYSVLEDFPLSQSEFRVEKYTNLKAEIRQINFLIRYLNKLEISIKLSDIRIEMSNVPYLKQKALKLSIASISASERHSDLVILKCKEQFLKGTLEFDSIKENTFNFELADLDFRLHTEIINSLTGINWKASPEEVSIQNLDDSFNSIFRDLEFSEKSKVSSKIRFFSNRLQLKIFAGDENPNSIQVDLSNFSVERFRDKFRLKFDSFEFKFNKIVICKSMEPSKVLLKKNVDFERSQSFEQVSPFSDLYTVFEEEAHPSFAADDEILSFKEHTLHSSIYVAECQIPHLKYYHSQKILNSLLEFIRLFKLEDLSEEFDDERLKESFLSAASNLPDTNPLKKIYPAKYTFLSIVASIEKIVVDCDWGCNSLQSTLKNCKIFASTQQNGENINILCIDIDDTECMLSKEGDRYKFLEKTLNSVNEGHPCVKIITVTNFTSTVETTMEVSIVGMTSRIYPEKIRELIRKSPSNISETPNSALHVFLEVKDFSVLHETLECAFNFHFGNIKITTNSSSPDLEFKLIFQNSSILFRNSLNAKKHVYNTEPLAFWASQGYFTISTIQFFQCSIKNVEKSVSVEIFELDLNLSVCSDTFQKLVDIFGQLQIEEEEYTLESPKAVNTTHDIDENAFERTRLEPKPFPEVELDFMEDFYPTEQTPEVLAGFFSDLKEETSSEEDSSLKSFNVDDTSFDQNVLVFGIENAPEDIVRILDDDFLLVEENFQVNEDGCNQVQIQDVDLRICFFDFSINLNLYGGTDSDADREEDHSMHFQAKNLSLDYCKFPNGYKVLSSLKVRIKQIEIVDNVRTSLWNKFLTNLKQIPGSQSSVNMIEMDFAETSKNEFNAKIRVQPLRLHVDQDALIFLSKFFTFKPSTNRTSNIFINVFELSPLFFRIDYKPKHLDLHDLQKGELQEILNLFHLEEADFELPAVTVRGSRSLKEVVDGIISQWMPFAHSTQIPNYVSGVAPVRTIAKIGNGVADLVLLPIKQYKRNGRILKGVQEGTRSFMAQTAAETLNLGAKVSVGVQVLLEHAYEIFEPSKVKKESKFANQPKNIQEGLQSAYSSIKKETGKVANTIFAIPFEMHETDSGGRVKSVIRAIPVAILGPLLGLSNAVTSTILGAQNTINPEKAERQKEKYREK